MVARGQLRLARTNAPPLAKAMSGVDGRLELEVVILGEAGNFPPVRLLNLLLLARGLQAQGS